MAESEIRIIPEGVSQAPTISARERTPIHPAKISQSAKLGDLKEYAWFTPALMYKYVPLTRDPLADFQAEHKLDLQIFSFRFEQPIFRGLEINNDPAWNHVLYGVEAENCEKLLAHLGTVAFMFNQAKPPLLCRLRPQRLTLLDPLLIDRGRTLSLPDDTLDVTALCLDTARGCYYFRRQGLPRHPNARRARLHQRPEAVYTSQTFDDTVRLGMAIARESARPYDAVLPDAASTLAAQAALAQLNHSSEERTPDVPGN